MITRITIPKIVISILSQTQRFIYTVEYSIAFCKLKPAYLGKILTHEPLMCEMWQNTPQYYRIYFCITINKIGLRKIDLHKNITTPTDREKYIFFLW